MATSFFLGACSDSSVSILDRLPSPADLPLVHKIDVQQGNVVTQDMLARLKPGMEKDKVKFIMGTPLIVDAFRDDRWDYFYSYKKGGGKVHQRRVSVFFKDDRLTYVDGNVIAASGELKPVRHRGTSVVIPGEHEDGFIDKMKSSIGLGDDKPDVPVDPAITQSTPEPIEKSLSEEEKRQKAAEKVVTIPEDTVTYEEEAKEKGFFGRLLQKMGVGDNEDETEYESGDIKYKDPTNPESTDPAESR